MLSAERVVVPDRLKGKIVRVLYTCSDETNKAFNKAVLEKKGSMTACFTYPKSRRRRSRKA